MKESEREVHAAVQGMRGKMEAWGISHTFLARQLDVSRQYVWQVLNKPALLSPVKARMIGEKVDLIIARQMHLRTLGDRLRAARRSADMTLKDVAATIGYSWVVVQRWEKNVSLPGIPVLLRLCGVYGISFEIVRSDRPRQGARGHMRGSAYLVPVRESDGLPAPRSFVRQPPQRMVIRISAGDLPARKVRSPRL